MWCLGSVLSAPGPSLAYLMEQSDSTVAQMAGVMAGRAMGYVIGATAGGPLCDRFNGHRVTSCALLIAGVTAFLIPHITALWLLAIVFAIQGCVTGSYDTTANILCFWLFRKDVGPYMQGLHFSFAAGGFVIPILLGVLIKLTGSIIGPWSVAGVFNLLVCAALFRLPPPRGDAEASAVSDWTPNYKRAIGLGFVLMFLYVGAEIGTGIFIAQFSIQMGLGDAAEAAFLTSVWWCFLALGRGLAVPVSMVFSPKNMVLMDATGSLIATGLLVISMHYLPGVYISIAIFGVSMASIFPSMLAVVDRLVTIDGKGTGVLTASGALGEMIIPLTIGQFLEQHPSSFPFVLLFTMLAFTGLFFVFLKCVHPRNLAQVEPISLEEVEKSEKAQRQADEGGGGGGGEDITPRQLEQDFDSLSPQKTTADESAFPKEANGDSPVSPSSPQPLTSPTEEEHELTYL